MMYQSLSFLFIGISLGFFAGISPGPLQTLVLSETIKYGKGAGIKVAISPLITDVIIIIGIMLLLVHLSEFNTIVGIIALCGASYLIFLGIMNLRIKAQTIEMKKHKGEALLRGIITNALSPHPYLFWLSIGGTIIIRSWEISFITPIFFLLGFYSLLIGSKIGLVLITDKSKSWIKSKYYLNIVRALGVLLIVYALFFIWDGVKLLGLL